jgi:hypothetical protein
MQATPEHNEPRSSRPQHPTQIIIRVLGGRMLLDRSTSLGRRISDQFGRKPPTQAFRVMLPTGTRAAVFEGDTAAPARELEVSELRIRTSHTVQGIVVVAYTPVVTTPPKIAASSASSASHSPPASSPANSQARSIDAFDGVVVPPPQAEVDVPKPVPTATTRSSPSGLKGNLKKPAKGSSGNTDSPGRIVADARCEAALRHLLTKEVLSVRLLLEKSGQTGKGWPEALIDAARVKYPHSDRPLSEMIQDIVHPTTSAAGSMVPQLASFLNEIITNGRWLSLSQDARIKSRIKPWAKEILGRYGSSQPEASLAVVHRNLTVAQLAQKLSDPNTPPAIQEAALSRLVSTLSREVRGVLKERDGVQRHQAQKAVSDAVAVARGSSAFERLPGRDKRELGSKLDQQVARLRPRS